MIPLPIEGDVGEVPVPASIPTIAIDEAVANEAANDTNPTIVLTVIPNAEMTMIPIMTDRGLEVIGIAVKVLPTPTTVENIVEAAPVAASVERNDIIITIIDPPVPVEVRRSEKDRLARDTSVITVVKIRIAIRIEIAIKRRMLRRLVDLRWLDRMAAAVMVGHRMIRKRRRRRQVKMKVESEQPVSKKEKNWCVPAS